MDVRSHSSRVHLPLLVAASFLASMAQPVFAQQAMLFSDHGEFLEIANDSSLATPEFTFEFWVQVRALGPEEEAGGEQTVFDSRGATGGINIRLAGTTWPISIFSFNGPGDSWAQGLGVIYPDEWIHVASVQNADSAKLYLNGEFHDGRESTYVPEPDWPIRIGDLQNSPDFSLPLRGALDEIRIWDHERPADSIMAHIHRPVPADAGGLRLYFDFEDVEVDTVRDLSSFGNDAAIFGGAHATESTAPVDWVPPPAPYGLRAFGDETRIDLIWKSYGSPVARYEILRGDSANFEPDESAVIAVIAVPDTTYTDNAVESGRFYYYRLRAKDADGHASEPGRVAASRTTVIQDEYLTGVHYNAVWGDDSGGRQWEDQYMRQYLVPPQMPMLGEYSNRDPLVIRQHLAWMEEYGIDFILPNWWSRWSWTGVTVKDYLLEELTNSSIKFAIMIRTARFGQGEPYDAADRDSLLTVFTHLSDYFFNHPNYLEIDGRKVVFLNAIAGCTGEFEEAWAAVRDSMSSLGHDLYLIGDDVRFEEPNATHLGFLDAAYIYGPYVVNEHSGYAAEKDFLPKVSTMMARWTELATDLGVAFVPSVMPGYNQRYANAGNQAIPRQIQPGARSTSLLEDFIRSMRPFVDRQLRMMLINSWNIWDGDSQIEPIMTAEGTSVDSSDEGDFYTQGYTYVGDGFEPLIVLRRLLAAELTIRTERDDPERDSAVLVSLYPNPFRDRARIAIEVPESVETSIEIYDVLGRLIETVSSRVNTGQADLVWDGSDLPSGLYFIQVHAGASRETIPILKIGGGP